MSKHREHTIFLQNQCVYIRNTPQSQILIEKLKHICTLSIKVYVQGRQKTEKEECWREWINEKTGIYFCVFPRHVLSEVPDLKTIISKWKPDSQQIINDEHDVVACLRSENYFFYGELKNDHRKQSEAVEAVLRSLKRTGGALLCMPPGTGKTVTTCFIISQLKVPTVVLTHSSELQTQWEERIRQFLPHVRIGKYTTNDPLTVDDYDVILVMMKTCSMPTTAPFHKVGLVVVDEAHHICAETLRECFDKFNCPYTLGLSATPSRKDRRTPLLYWMIGPMAFLLHVPYEAPVHLMTIEYEDARMAKHKNSHFQCMRAISLNKKRIQDILTLAFSKIPNIAQRNILVLAYRLDIISQAHEYTRTILAPKYNIACDDVQRMISGSTAKNAHAKSSAKVLFCTSALVSEGFDLPRLDTLIRLMPSAESIQTYGRVMRMCDEKVLPVYLVEVNDVSNDYLRALYNCRVRILIRGFTDTCPFTNQDFTQSLYKLAF
jgi:superfamily II DNA or RNA helicase